MNKQTAMAGHVLTCNCDLCCELRERLSKGKIMATELQVNSLLDGVVSLTQFFGGEARGVCVQVTQLDSRATRDGAGYVQLTPEQAWALAVELRAWALPKMGGAA